MKKILTILTASLLLIFSSTAHAAPFGWNTFRSALLSGKYGASFTTETVTKQLFSAATELTISGGAVTVTQTAHRIDTQGDAASDDLDTINGGSAGQMLFIRADHADRTVVVKHNTGNILTGGSDISLTDTNKYLLLMYDGTLSKWVVVSGGGGSGDMTNPMTTAGDIIVGGADGTPGRLAKGANNSIFGVNSAGILGYYTSILIDNSAAQFYDATTPTKLIKVSPVNVTATKTFTFAPYVTDDVTHSPTITSSYIDYGGLGLITTGVIKGRINIVADADGRTIGGVTEITGTLHLATGAGTWTLPDRDSSAGVGQNLCLYSTGDNAVVLDPDAEDKIRYNGTLGGAGKSLTSASQAGNFVCVVLTDYDGDIAHWTTFGVSGTWTLEE